jgi:DNA-directed RNA polymerase specialized sigma subunit
MANKLNVVDLQKLILSYKKSKSKARRNQLGIKIIDNYKWILAKLIGKYACSDCDKDDITSIFYLQLFSAIENYDITKPTTFASYCYYYLLGVERMYWGSQLTKHKLSRLYDDSIIDDLGTDEVVYHQLQLDLHKILTPEERLIYDRLTVKRISSKEACDKLYNKLYNYIKE